MKDGNVEGEAPARGPELVRGQQVRRHERVKANTVQHGPVGPSNLLHTPALYTFHKQAA